MTRKLSIAFVSFVGLAPHLLYPQTTELHFAKGTSGVTLTGTLKGETDKNYSFFAKKDQQVLLEVLSKGTANLVFRVFPESQPEGADVINNFISSESKGSGVLPVDGKYV